MLSKRTFILFFLFCFAIFFYSCSSSETATYKAGENENWKINVVHQVKAVDNFKVIINDSTVIDKNVNAVTSKIEETGKYRNREVKLLVSYINESYGSGYFDALVYIENKLAAKFKF
jgi:hypothetical protein